MNLSYKEIISNIENQIGVKLIECSYTFFMENEFNKYNFCGYSLNENEQLIALHLNNDEYNKNIQYEINMNGAFNIDLIQSEINLKYLFIFNLKLENIFSINKLINLEKLGIIFSKIINVSFLQNCLNLKMLSLSHNNIKNIVGLNKLQNIEYLDISNNKIEKIDFKLNIKTIKKLILNNNLIDKIDSSYFESTPNLEYLDISSNKIEKISFISNIKTLKTLLINNNFISNIDSFCFDGIQNLEVLDIGKNKLSDKLGFKILVECLEKLYGIASEIKNNNLNTNIKFFLEDFETFKNKGFINLRSELSLVANPEIGRAILNPLDGRILTNAFIICRNKYNLFPNYIDFNVISFPIKIKNLTLSQNIIADLTFLKKYQNLEILNIGHNFITDVTPLGVLKRIKEVTLEFNAITDIENIILELNNLKKINTSANPIDPFIIEKLKIGIPALRDYFMSILNPNDRKQLNEAKLIFVGKGDVGKSELIQALVDENYKFSKGRQTTKAIDITQWKPKDCIKHGKETPFAIHIWDFAGQEINYNTHQFFLTESAIYVFVWEDRKGEDDKGFEYWFNIISLLSNKSPIIVVQNKKDIKINSEQINESDWKKQFPNIVTFLKTSCKKDVGLSKLRTEIIKQITKLQHTSTVWNKTRFSIREQLKTKKLNYISYEEFEQLCFSQDLDRWQSDFLAQDLNIIGDILHYRTERLKNTIILKPEWATKAAYDLLDSKKIDTGRFELAHLAEIWHEPMFEHNRPFLLDLMIYFQIIFKLEGSSPEQYIVPERLPTKEKLDLSYFKQSNDEKEIQFEYRYNFMPKGILTRFICRQHRFIKNELFAVDAVVLEHNDTLALVESNKVNQRIKITVRGNAASHLLFLIRSELDSINQDLKNPSLDKVIPCPCIQCKNLADFKFFDYERIKLMQMDGIADDYCEKGRIKIPLSLMLEGIKETKQEELQNQTPSIVNNFMGGDFNGANFGQTHSLNNKS
jgi:internalin A